MLSWSSLLRVCLGHVKLGWQASLHHGSCCPGWSHPLSEWRFHPCLLCMINMWCQQPVSSTAASSFCAQFRDDKEARGLAPEQILLSALKKNNMSPLECYWVNIKDIELVLFIRISQLRLFHGQIWCIISLFSVPEMKCSLNVCWSYWKAGRMIPTLFPQLQLLQLSNTYQKPITHPPH